MRFTLGRPWLLSLSSLIISKKQGYSWLCKTLLSIFGNLLIQWYWTAAHDVPGWSHERKGWTQNVDSTQVSHKSSGRFYGVLKEIQLHFQRGQGVRYWAATDAPSDKGRGHNGIDICSGNGLVFLCYTNHLWLMWHLLYHHCDPVSTVSEQVTSKQRTETGPWSWNSQVSLWSPLHPREPDLTKWYSTVTAPARARIFWGWSKPPRKVVIHWIRTWCNASSIMRIHESRNQG